MLSIVAIKKIIIAVFMALFMGQNVAWCDSCGEMCNADEMHGSMCTECTDYWNN